MRHPLISLPGFESCAHARRASRQTRSSGAQTNHGAWWVCSDTTLFDLETGLVRFGAREYDPEVGRWISKDPVVFGDGYKSLYAYSSNDPVNNIDVNGLIQLNPNDPTACFNTVRNPFELAKSFVLYILSGFGFQHLPDRGKIDFVSLYPALIRTPRGVELKCHAVLPEYGYLGFYPEIYLLPYTIELSTFYYEVPSYVVRMEHLTAGAVSVGHYVYHCASGRFTPISVAHARSLGAL